jgi:hypothetical protein
VYVSTIVERGGYKETKPGWYGVNMQGVVRPKKIKAKQKKQTDFLPLCAHLFRAKPLKS